MAEQVLLYPNRNGAGVGDPSQGCYFPPTLVDKMLKNGWATVPDVSNRKVAESLIESAQKKVQETLNGVNQEKQQLQSEREAFLKEKAAFDALKGKSKTAEV